MRQKVPYGIFGFLCGMAVAVLIIAPILQLVTHNRQNPIPGLYFFLIILILGTIGVFVGLKLDEYVNAGQQQGIIPKIASVSTKYLSFFAFGSRRVEGNYIVYETHNLQNFFVATCLIICALIARKYIVQPFEEILEWVVLLAYIIGGLPMANDSVRATSKKIIINAKGKREVWYEITKNIT